MLKINVFHINNGPIELKIDVHPLELDLRDEVFTFEGKVTGKIRFKLIEENIEGRGELDVEAVTACGRCLEPVRCPIHIDLNEIWLDRRSLEGENTDVMSADFMAEIYEGNEIDLTETLRERIMATLPDFPICSESCKGLCSGCGENLNRGPCRCDPRQEPEKPVAEAQSAWKETLRSLRKNS